MITYHQRNELTAQATIAVFTAERAAVFFHQQGDVGSDFAKHLEAFGSLEVEERASVQLAGSGMCVIDAVDAVFGAQQFIEFGDIVRQVAHIDRRVLDHLAWLCVTDDIAHQALAGSAQLPNLVSIGTPKHRSRVAHRGILPIIGESVDRGLRFFARVAADFNNEDRSRFADDEVAVALLCDIRLGAFENVVVDQFASAGVVGQREKVGVERFVDGVEMSADQCGVGWGER